MQLIIYDNKMKIYEEDEIKNKNLKFLIRFHDIRQLNSSS